MAAVSSTGVLAAGRYTSVYAPVPTAVIAWNISPTVHLDFCM
jgi:hypothetical protein